MWNTLRKHIHDTVSYYYNVLIPYPIYLVDTMDDMYEFTSNSALKAWRKKSYIGILYHIILKMVTH